jgi:hypothetical protein
MRQMIENQLISARLDNCQVVLDRSVIGLGVHFESASDLAPLYLGRRLRETATAMTTMCRHCREAVRAALDGMLPISMSAKPRLGWLVKQPIWLRHSVR